MKPSQQTFERLFSLEYRRNLCQKFKADYPEKVAVILQKHPKGKTKNSISKIKYVVPRHNRLATFYLTVHNEFKLSCSKNLYLYVNNCLVPYSLTLGELEELYAAEDGFLYIYYSQCDLYG